MWPTACHPAAAPPPKSPRLRIGTPPMTPPSSLLPKSAVTPSAANTRSASPFSAVAVPSRPTPQPLSSTRAGDTGTSPHLLAHSSPRLLATAVPSHLLDRPLLMPVSDLGYAARQNYNPFVPCQIHSSLHLASECESAHMHTHSQIQRQVLRDSMPTFIDPAPERPHQRGTDRPEIAQQSPSDGKQTAGER